MGHGHSHGGGIPRARGGPEQGAPGKGARLTLPAWRPGWWAACSPAASRRCPTPRAWSRTPVACPVAPAIRHVTAGSRTKRSRPGLPGSWSRRRRWPARRSRGSNSTGAAARGRGGASVGDPQGGGPVARRGDGAGAGRARFDHRGGALRLGRRTHRECAFRHARPDPFFFPRGGRNPVGKSGAVTLIDLHRQSPATRPRLASARTVSDHHSTSGPAWVITNAPAGGASACATSPGRASRPTTSG